jgi:hypothetical protein
MDKQQVGPNIILEKNIANQPHVIDIENLKNLIQNKKKVFITAPRRSGKTFFISRKADPNDYVMLLSLQLLNEFVDQTKQTRSFIPLVYNSNDFDNFEFLKKCTGTVFVDDVLWMPDHIQDFIEELQNIVIISSEREKPSQDRIKKYKEKGFEIIDAPLIPLGRCIYVAD